MKVMDKFLDIMGFSESRDDAYPDEQDSAEFIPEWRPQRAKGQVVPITTNKMQNKVILLEPACFDDCQQISDHLKSKRIIIINLENLDKTLARRIIDFVGGTAYALEGCLQKVGVGIIVAAPNNVDISGDLNSESQPKEVFAWINNIIEDSDKRRSLF